MPRPQVPACFGFTIELGFIVLKTGQNSTSPKSNGNWSTLRLEYSVFFSVNLHLLYAK